jgi:hypothetical protein
MYRIELSPGEETAFRSIEELAVAIRRGVVTSKARIWHNATSKWLPIQFHPHYQTAVAMPLSQADLVAGPPVTPLSALNLPDPNAPAPRVAGFRPIDPSPQTGTPIPTPRVAPSKPTSPYHQPAAQLPPAPVAGLPLIDPFGSAGMPAPVKPEPLKPLAARPAPALPRAFKPLPPAPPPARKAPPVAEASSKKKKARSKKSSRRGLRAALIAAFFIGGAHLVMSASGALRSDSLRTHRRLVAAPPEATKLDSPRTVAAVIPVLRNSSVPGGSRLPHNSPLIPASGVTQASLPAMTPASDSGAEIEAAPTVEMPVPTPMRPDSLTSTPPDSTGKKRLKGILKAVSGASGTEQARPKR